MKNRAGAVLALMCLTSVPARASGLSQPFKGTDNPPTVTLVRVTLGANDSRSYEMKGFVVSSGHTFNFTGVGFYNPASGKASERLQQMGANGPDGGEILTLATCPKDPWVGLSTCTGATITAKGYVPQIEQYITGLKAPITAGMVFVSDALKAAEAEAAAKKAKMQGIVNRKVEPVPTPTPQHLTVERAHLAVGPAGAPAKLVYGAVYTGGNPPAAIKAGHVVDVPVTVQNTSSQTWPAGGAFRLSFHWFRNGARFADGDRTLMPSAVAPGASVNLNAKVTAPSRAGDATLQWDMEQEGAGWFSDKGVAMSAPKAVSVKP